MADNPAGELKHQIGERITRIREMRGLKGKDLAEKMGVDPVQVSQWENGSRTVSTKHLPGLASALGVPVDALFDDSGRSLPYLFRQIAGALEATSAGEDAAARDTPPLEDGDEETGTG